MFRGLQSKLDYYRARVKYHMPYPIFLRMAYKERTGKWLNLGNPRTFNEKLQWLKLNYQPTLQVQLVDKYAVRAYVEQRVGEAFLIPLHGVFDEVDQINPDQLPGQFVLKPNHGSGWVVICGDKASFDWPVARAKLQAWMETDYGQLKYEWAYSQVPRKIVCEELLVDEHGQVPMDFKFFCVDGQPEFVQVDLDRFSDHKRNLYDLNWNRLPVEFGYASTPEDVTRPAELETMVKCVAELSRGLPFCRVDLYAPPGRVLFGEITFYPEGGYGNFRPADFAQELGDKITLPAPCRQS